MQIMLSSMTVQNKMDGDWVYTKETNVSQEMQANVTNSTDMDKDNDELFFCLNCLTITCAVCSIIFNSLVLITVKKFKMLHTATNILFLGLAATNASFGTTVLCSRIIMNIHNTILTVICAIDHFIVTFNMYSNLYIISMVTFDRYIAITKSTSYKSVMTHHRCHQMLLCSFMWAVLLAFVSTLQVLISWRQEKTCLLDFMYWKWFSAIIVIQFCLLILLMFFAYTVILWSPCQQRQQLLTSYQCKQYRAQLKISCLTATITVAAVLCYSPQIFYVALVTSRYFWLDQVRTVGLILNSAIQPLLVLQSGDFRKCFRKMVRRNKVTPEQEEQRPPQVHAIQLFSLVSHETENT